MIRVGSRVTVLVTSADDFKPAGWVGQKGVVVQKVLDGTGATPKDPLFIVRAKILGKQRKDAFWREELDWLP